MNFNQDTLEIIQLLNKHDVKYLIIGGIAAMYYGHVRYTGDIDFYYDNSSENSHRLYLALVEFWGGSVPMIKDSKDIEKKGQVLQFGVPPNRLDFINDISGVTFSSCWENRVIDTITVNDTNIEIPYIGIKNLIENKKASNRKKDQMDVEYLSKLKKQ